MNTDLKQQQPLFGEHTHTGTSGTNPFFQNLPSQNFGTDQTAYNAYPQGHQTMPLGQAGNVSTHNYTDKTVQPGAYNAYPSVQGQQTMPFGQGAGVSHNFGTDQTIRPDAYSAHSAVQGHQAMPVGQGAGVSHNYTDKTVQPGAYNAYPSVQGQQTMPFGQGAGVSHNIGTDQTIRPDAYNAHSSVQGHQTIPGGHAGNVPFGHEDERKTEHVHLNPSEQINVAPNAEHLHITAGQAGPNVEQVIRIKPDGQVQVTAEKVGEHHTEPLRREPAGLEKEHHMEPIRKEEKEHHESKLKKLTDMLKPAEKEKDVPMETTTTVVTLSEHEPGTAGYNRDGRGGKHDDAHHQGSHGRKDHGDTHHGNDKHHGGLFGKKDHGDTHHGTDTHHHGADETKVKVYKVPKSGKKKDSKKHRGDRTSDTTTVVEVSDNKHGTAGKHYNGTGATKVGKDIE